MRVDPDWEGRVLRVRWRDAFQESETRVEDLKDEYLWDTRGLCVRARPGLVTVAHSVKADDEGFVDGVTTIPAAMLVEVEVLT